MHGILASLAAAASRAILALSEQRARLGGMRGPKAGKKKQRPGKVATFNKFKNAPGAGCGTGAGGFKAGNNCQKEDGMPNKTSSPYAALKQPNAKALKQKAEQMKAKASFKQAKKQAQDKQKSIDAKRKKAALRKKEKEAKAAEDGKQRAEALAKKRAEMLKVIRKKRADEKLQIIGDKTVDVQQISKNKAAAASKKLEVVGTPKSLAEEIAEAKAAAAAKTAAKGKPAPYRRPDTPPEPDPPAATPPPSSLTVVKTLGGSTGAKLAKDTAGNEYVVKGGKSAAHVRSESQADDLYRAAGVNVPKQQVHDTPDGPQKVAEFIKGKTLGELKVSNPKQYEAAVKKLRKDFVADALFGNRDVVGMDLDNIIVGKGGKVYRIDNGGSLTFRAQGATKDFGPDIKELDGLRNPSINPAASSVFGGITNKEVSAQITALMKRKEAILAAARSPELRAALEKRFDSLEKWQKQHRAQQKSTAAVAKSFKPSSRTTQHAEYFTQALAAKIAEFRKSGQANSESGKRIERALRTGITTDKMSEAERNKVVEVVWDTIPKAERDAVWKWGSNSWQILRDKMKSGQYDDPEVKNLIAGLKKLPSYRGVASRDLNRIEPQQAKKWIADGEWDTSFPSSPQNPTAASFSAYNKAETLHKKGSFTKGDVTVVVSGARSIMDTGAKMPYYAHGAYGEKEALAQHTGRYKLKRHYWMLDKSHPLVKAGKLTAYKSYSQAEVNAASGKPTDLHFHDNVRLVVEVEEIIPNSKRKKK